MRYEILLVAALWSGAVLAGYDECLEKSALFEPRVDEGSSFRYKVLKHGTGGGWNHQQLYFVQKSLTDDGRYLLVCASDNEYGAEKPRKGWQHRVQIIDLANDKVIDFDGKASGFCTCLDRKNDRVWQVTRDGFFYFDLKAENPTNMVKVCPLPENLLAEEKSGGRIRIIVGHLTLNNDATGAFLDTILQTKSVQGFIDFRTGKYEKWGEIGCYIFHGQTNPKNSKIALACFESCRHLANYEADRLSPEEKSQLTVEPTRLLMASQYLRPEKWAFPRLQLFEPGRRTTVVPLYCSYVTHERWDEQGEGFYWCSREGVWYHDLATGDEYVVSPHGSHAFMSANRRFVVSDVCHPAFGWYRGCRWRTYFYDRETKKGVYFNSDIARYAPDREHESHIHPDPHPQFVCNDRYVLWTHNLPGRCELAFAKTDDLVKACERDPVASLAELATPERSAKVDPETELGRQLVRMAEALKSLPNEAPERGKIVADFKRQMEKLVRSQREDGRWEKDTLPLAHAMTEGVRMGVIDPELYAPTARRAWLRIIEKEGGRSCDS